MSQDRFAAQAEAIFEARLEELIARANEDIARVLAGYNKRGLLRSSGVVAAVYQVVDSSIGSMGQIAVASVKTAYETTDCKFSAALESAFVEAFDQNFALGYKRVSALRERVLHIRRSLSNQMMLATLDSDAPSRQTKIEGQAELRRYYQELRAAHRQQLHKAIGTAAAVVGAVVTAVAAIATAVAFLFG